MDANSTLFNHFKDIETGKLKIGYPFVDLEESSWVILDEPEYVDNEFIIMLNNEEPSEINNSDFFSTTTEHIEKIYDEFKEPSKNADETTNRMMKNISLWYDRQIDSATRICRDIQDISNPELTHYQKCIKKFPRCVVISIRKLCKCNEDCLYKFKIHEKFRFCNLYDFTTYIYDNKFVECCWPINFTKDNLRYLDRNKSLEKTIKRFHNELNTLCQKTENFNITKCTVYELQDDCYYNNCKDKRIIHLLEHECLNSNFHDQVKELQLFVNFYIIKSKELQFRLHKREIRNDKFINITKKSSKSINSYEQYTFLVIFIVFYLCLGCGLIVKFRLSKKKTIALIISGLCLLTVYLSIINLNVD